MAGSIGIAVHPVQLGAHGRKRARRGPQRVLVRGQLDGIGDSELSFEFFDRLSRLVGIQIADVRIDEVSQAHLLSSATGNCARGKDPRSLLE